MLASAVRGKLNSSGSCQKSIDNQLKTIDDFTLTVESIKLAGASASARVQTEYNGSKVISTVTLAHEKAGWRINSIAAL